MNVVELRRYALKSGRRDDLIDLFEREFVHTQEACGVTLFGHYRDVDDPDSFVWFRGFASMEQRRGALEAFYLHSPAWLEHREAANDTMIDSDNVLLLRPARPHSGFERATIGRDSAAAVSIFMLDAPADEAYISEFEGRALPALQRIARTVSYFVTESSPNTFPRLPVREGEWAFVVAGLCADGAAVDAWHNTFAAPERLRLIGTSYRR